MKNKKNKFYKPILFAFFSFLLLAGNFVFIPQAQAAACNYSVTLEAKPTTARVDETITLTATADRATTGGLLSNCASSASFNFQYKTKSGSTITLGSKTASFSGSRATTSYTVDLKNLYSSSIKPNLSDPNKIILVIEISLLRSLRNDFN